MGYAYDGDLDLGFGNYARRGERWVQVRGAPLTVSDSTVKTSRAVARSLAKDALGDEQVVLRHLLHRHASVVVRIHHREVARHRQALEGRVGSGVSSAGRVKVRFGLCMDDACRVTERRCTCCTGIPVETLSSRNERRGFAART